MQEAEEQDNSLNNTYTELYGTGLNINNYSQKINLHNKQQIIHILILYVLWNLYNLRKHNFIKIKYLIYYLNYN